MVGAVTFCKKPLEFYEKADIDAGIISEDTCPLTCKNSQQHTRVETLQTCRCSRIAGKLDWATLWIPLHVYPFEISMGQVYRKSVLFYFICWYIVASLVVSCSIQSLI
jgi:hypothetical protein